MLKSLQHNDTCQSIKPAHRAFLYISGPAMSPILATRSDQENLSSSEIVYTSRLQETASLHKVALKFADT